MSFITLIPPLDGMLLNYRKLDEWREQRHFRIQLEAQRIYEQQLQQEQALAGLIPHHMHANGVSIHGSGGGGGGGTGVYSLNGMGSPKQFRQISNGGGGGGRTLSTGPTVLKSIFSPPLPSPITNTAGNSVVASTVESVAVSHTQGSAIPKDLDDYSEIILEPAEEGKPSLSSKASTAGDSRTRGFFASGNQDGPVSDSRLGQTPGMSVRLDKELPPIVTKATVEHPTYAVPTTFTLMTPYHNGNMMVEEENTGAGKKINSGNTRAATDDMTPRYPSGGDSTAPQPGGGPISSIFKSVNSSMTDVDMANTKLGENQHTPVQSSKAQTTKTIDYPLPLRLTNKPVPPYDPFRKASHTPSSQAAVPSTSAPMVSTSVIASVCQSMYHPPPPSRLASTAGQSNGYGRGVDSISSSGSAGKGGTAPITDRGVYRRLSSDATNGIQEPAVAAAAATPSKGSSTTGRTGPGGRVQSGGYGMVGITTLSTKPSSVPYPLPPSFPHKPYQQYHRGEPPPMLPQFQFQLDEPEDSNDMSPMMPSHGQERNYRSENDSRVTKSGSSGALVGMPDIVLTLPTPGESSGGGNDRDGYFD
ncbi:hypothetical protein BGW41_000137 [Actinomortierella wolfii]|nr:hypothetical protein BGW41_000137 [Actinomortierella wolfii]